jgi:hypothetical protein
VVREYLELHPTTPDSSSDTAAGAVGEDDVHVCPPVETAASAPEVSQSTLAPPASASQSYNDSQEDNVKDTASDELKSTEECDSIA